MKLKRLRTFAASAAVGCLLAAGIGGAAFASTDDELTVLDALELTALTDEAPTLLNNVSAPEDAGIVIPDNSGEPIIVGSGAEEISVQLPGASVDGEDVGEGLVGYDGGDGSIAVPIPKDDGSIQLISVIEGAASPTEYRYEFNLPAGASLSAVEDGGVAVRDEDGEVLYAVLAPWAVDADGAAVDTRYEVDGTALVQHVAHTSANAYPVVADPWLGGTWVQEWSWYSGATRIAMTPTTFAQWACPGNVSCALTWQGVAATELANAQVTQANKNKINASTTRNQIGCHMVAGPLKSPWNLETNKPDIGLPGFIATLCNP
ncbi:DUF2599 domain-containing protein [Microbacterium caowuchunii]|uniref:DUF2599 domain-containing protein n=1 Tax=Microbacterium caowuchunii TaxID=2614638 RepID=UPI0012475470|nr:DUF2599 domain-containing protein [Microbacterium caowuchunii]QEW00618.1 DUF2599 domain-containing protein [Microbacterium caowuchunii]